MKTLKKKLLVALTVALLAFPLCTTLTLASMSDSQVVIAATALDTEPVVETAVAAYENAPITTLTEVATAEDLKATADTVVATVSDPIERTAFEVRVTNRAAAIEAAKITLTPVVDGDGNIVTPSTWLSDLIGKLQLALTFDPARKGELNERHALEKLAEAQKLMQENKPEAAQICIDKYTEKIAKAQTFLDQVKDPTSEAAIALAYALANVNSNNIRVLGNLIDKLPPQAAQKLALNVVRSMEKAVTKIQKEEANVALETTPVATSATTPVVDYKTLEEQTKVALEKFKKSLNQKGKVHIEEQGQEESGDKNVVEQSKLQSQSPQTQPINKSQPTNVTVAPINPSTLPTVTPSADQGREKQSTQSKSGENNGMDKKDNH